MSDDQLEERDYWRAIILYGRNTATYKIALGHALAGFAKQGKSHVTMHELAETFFDLYLTRLEGGKPQLLSPDRQTVMETIVQLFNSGQLSHEQAIDRVEREAFEDVIPRFHNVNNEEVPIRFYEHTKSGLVLTDNVFEVMDGDDRSEFIGELDARWDLLEAAFQMKREDLHLANDIRIIYLARGYERTNITRLVPVLNGYQNGVCFYCGEVMPGRYIHVDHVIPRQLVRHDEIWNLVLAHSICNEQKSDSRPLSMYIDKLIQRNEYFIASNHPIRDRLISELGFTPIQRAAHIYKTYDDAKIVIKHEWGSPGYNPATDPFFRRVVRTMLS